MVGPPATMRRTGRGLEDDGEDSERIVRLAALLDD
jgi:hypothetical protein